MGCQISDSQWTSYQELGYLQLGQLLGDSELDALRQRIDDIMLGKAGLDYNRLLMQLDSDTGKYADAGVQSMGHKGGTLGYRKIQNLELDPLFLNYLQRPIFKEICDRVYGPKVPLACFRAMFMNKPARKGTFLPWHQDRWTHLDRDPLITLWTALDPATVANGCVQIIPASHKQGLINPSHSSGFLTPDQTEYHCPPEKIVYLELRSGEAVLLHNHLLHASDVNKTDIPAPRLQCVLHGCPDQGKQRRNILVDLLLNRGGQEDAAETRWREWFLNKIIAINTQIEPHAKLVHGLGPVLQFMAGPSNIRALPVFIPTVPTTPPATRRTSHDSSSNRLKEHIK